MQIMPVDQDLNLFSIKAVVSQDLQRKILSTPWMDLDYDRQPGQENWPRRLIKQQQLTWLSQWNEEISRIWPEIESAVSVKLCPYSGTAFWFDEPGFTCGIHTDGEMPGSLHLCWIGEKQLGTTFYRHKKGDEIRFRAEFSPNTGYVMINQSDDFGYRKLQWHGMLESVPLSTYRLTSYTWLVAVK